MKLFPPQESRGRRTGGFAEIAPMLIQKLTLPQEPFVDLRPTMQARWPNVAEEKRLYHRVKVRWPTTLVTRHGPVNGMTRNLSIGGAFIYYNVPDPQALLFRAGDRVQIVFEVPGHEEVQAYARVMWSDILAVEEGGTLLGSGLQFLDVSAEDREFLLTAIGEKLSLADSEGVRIE